MTKQTVKINRKVANELIEIFDKITTKVLQYPILRNKLILKTYVEEYKQFISELSKIFLSENSEIVNSLSEQELNVKFNEFILSKENKSLFLYEEIEIELFGILISELEGQTDFDHLVLSNLLGLVVFE